MKQFLIAMLGVFCLQPAAFAEGVTVWKEGYGYKARLIEGQRIEDGSLYVGLDIVLDDGWKTYWRVPGDNGIPPDLQFDQSQNLDKVEIAWPAPSVFSDGRGKGVGYKERLVLPIKITPFFAGEPVTLDLSAFFGVCSDVCVPAQEHFSLELDPDAPDQRLADLVATALARVPRAEAQTTSKVLKTQYEVINAQDYLTISLKHPRELKTQLAKEDHFVLVEGPKDWYFVPTVFHGNAEDETLEVVKVKFFRNNDHPLTQPVKLRVTLTGPSTAIEKVMTLNPGAKI